MHSFFDQHDKTKIISHILEDLNKLDIIPCLSIEFEFYISKYSKDLIEDIKSFAVNRGINILDITSEASDRQYEVIFDKSFDIIKLIDQFNKIKKIINELASSYQIDLNFNGKPFGEDMHGNGMHFNISLHDKHHNNLFTKSDHKESELLLKSINSLLKYMNNSLIFMINENSDFERYNEIIKIDQKQKRYQCSSSYAPTHICWGKNNRTTAIRIPDSSSNPDSRHIEYRTPVPNADISSITFLLLFQIMIGVKSDEMPPEPIYGNAFEKQYNLTKLHDNYQAAYDDFENSILKEKLEHYISQIN
jgi:glutamine synthetase